MESLALYRKRVRKVKRHLPNPFCNLLVWLVYLELCTGASAYFGISLYFRRVGSDKQYNAFEHEPN